MATPTTDMIFHLLIVYRTDLLGIIDGIVAYLATIVNHTVAEDLVMFEGLAGTKGLTHLVVGSLACAADRLDSPCSDAVATLCWMRIRGRSE
jgi:hypothetical protein